MSCYLKQYPTKALAPFMLEDYRKVTMGQRGEEKQYSYEDILRCMKKGNVSSV
jgi:integrator complex subunit 11